MFKIAKLKLEKLIKKQGINVENLTFFNFTIFVDTNGEINLYMKKINSML